VSIHDHKSASTIVAELKMTRAKLPHGSFMLLEGGDDKRFWNRWIDAQACSAIISGGKLNLLGALRKLDIARFRGVLGIVDADFDRVRCRVCPSPNVVWTHGHDLEATLIRVGAARAVVYELGDPDRLRAFEAREKATLEAALLDRALVFGHIRCAQALYDADIDMSWLKISRFVDRAWILDRARLDQVADEEGLGPAMTAVTPWLARAAVDPWDLVNGHDLVELLRIGLGSAFGSLPPSRGASDIAAALRLAVDSIELRRSPLFEAIEVWEEANRPHAVLRALP
jgi:hypothetical protein